MYADMLDTIGFVSKYDPELGSAMQEELARQRRNIELIASENLVSPAVMAAMDAKKDAKREMERALKERNR